MNSIPINLNESLNHQDTAMRLSESLDRFNILLIEDNETDARAFIRAFKKVTHSFHIFHVLEVQQALQIFNATHSPGFPHIVISDHNLPVISVIECYKRLKLMNINVPFILLTGMGDESLAVEALKAGVDDYIIKDTHYKYLEILPFVIDDTLRKYTDRIERLRIENLIRNKDDQIKTLEFALKDIKKNQYQFDEIISKNDAMQKIFKVIHETAPTQAPILITGESGTGKELVARAIHKFSQKVDDSFIAVNCGAIPNHLLESELFGYEKGAFTGAVKRHIGKFEYASNGTIFLDEIGELPLSLQVKLLRVIQEKKVDRLGGNDSITIDTRIVSATNRNLQEMVDTDLFRSDLFYRLNVISIHIPPLRERKEDIPLLAMHFVDKYNKLYGKQISTISTEVMEYLIEQPWKGNIRELENFIERAVITNKADALEVNPIIRDKSVNPSLSPQFMIDASIKGIKQQTQRFERYYITNMLKNNQFNIKKTALDLEISVRNLYRKINEYSIPTNKHS